MTLPKSTLDLHRASSARGDAGYIDPSSGLFVLTSAYLRAQQECCGSGCRHCPWDEEEQRAAGRDPNAPCYPEP